MDVALVFVVIFGLSVLGYFTWAKWRFNRRD
jgi:hypothetical protein